ncbi:MAG: sulfite exporter TauE/SafE family protein [Tabrizicola sp.]|nr:sulfite exporter TauE/SafE family protein [Tabrizicola sp.]
MIEFFTAGLSLQAFAAALALTLFAGFVKGAVGFAMPLILVSGFAIFLPKELALAGLILPTLITNISQAFRQGAGPAKATAITYRRFLIGTVACIALSAPFADDIPRTLYLLLLGIPITIFAGLQLMGRSLAIQLHHQNRAEWGLGVVGGLYGGISGIWGPPLLVFLLSTGADKLQMIRAQGVVFLIGAVALLASHLGTGLANAQTLGFSAALCVPALAGLYAGYLVQDRLDQQRFRRWTQGLLVLTGLNMVRLALFGP